MAERLGRIRSCRRQLVSELLIASNRQIALFGSAATIGVALSVVLFNHYDRTKDDARPQVEVVTTKCALAAGDALTSECVELKSVAPQLAPPGAIRGSSAQAYVGRTLKVALQPGFALRAADFEDRR